MVSDDGFVICNMLNVCARGVLSSQPHVGILIIVAGLFMYPISKCINQRPCR